MRYADRVVVIWPRERTMPTTIGEVSYATFRSWQQEARGFVQLAAMGSTTWSLVLQEREPETIPIAAVSASFFPLAGVTAALGRTLQPGDAAGAAVAVPAGRALTGLLFGVPPLDPLTSAAMALLLVAVSAAALSLPAWKAARTEPALALKQL